MRTLEAYLPMFVIPMISLIGMVAIYKTTAATREVIRREVLMEAHEAGVAETYVYPENSKEEIRSVQCKCDQSLSTAFQRP